MKDNKKETPKSSRYGFAWWAKNLLIAAALGMIGSSLLKSNMGYEWVIDGYIKSNKEAMTQLKEFNNDQKLEAKLGYDYAFIEMIRKSTPDSAVIYYPPREDISDNPKGSSVQFTGNLCDKLTAVRFLYPRRVVIKKELGKTSWSKKLTHVAIINGHGQELLPYKMQEQMPIGVMPMDSVAGAAVLKAGNQ